MDSGNHNSGTVRVTVPSTISIRDVIVIMGAIVSVVVSWGFYGTRLSLVEERLVLTTASIDEIKQDIARVRTDFVEQHKVLHEIQRKQDVQTFELNAISRRLESSR